MFNMTNNDNDKDNKEQNFKKKITLMYSEC